MTKVFQHHMWPRTFFIAQEQDMSGEKLKGDISFTDGQGGEYERRSNVWMLRDYIDRFYTEVKVAPNE